MKDIKLNLLLELEKKPMLINGNGKIRMEGGKSSYYSLTRLNTSGNIVMKDESIPVAGISWMDHQWGNFRVIKRHWDWFSFQMEDSTEYNLFSFRDKKNRTLKQFVNILDEQNKTYTGQQIVISRKDWWHNQKTSHRYSTDWEIILPDRKDTFTVKAMVKNQELFAKNIYDFLPSYWEGACTVVKRTAEGKAIQGLGFAELFPYRNNKNK